MKRSGSPWSRPRRTAPRRRWWRERSTLAETRRGGALGGRPVGGLPLRRRRPPTRPSMAMRIRLPACCRASCARCPNIARWAPRRGRERLRRAPGLLHHRGAARGRAAPRARPRRAALRGDRDHRLDRQRSRTLREDPSSGAAQQRRGLLAARPPSCARDGGARRRGLGRPAGDRLRAALRATGARHLRHGPGAAGGGAAPGGAAEIAGELADFYAGSPVRRGRRGRRRRSPMSSGRTGRASVSPAPASRSPSPWRSTTWSRAPPAAPCSGSTGSTVSTRRPASKPRVWAGSEVGGEEMIASPLARKPGERRSEPIVPPSSRRAISCRSTSTCPSSRCAAKASGSRPRRAGGSSTSTVATPWRSWATVIRGCSRRSAHQAAGASLPVERGRQPGARTGRRGAGRLRARRPRAGVLRQQRRRGERERAASRFSPDRAAQGRRGRGRAFTAAPRPRRRSPGAPSAGTAFRPSRSTSSSCRAATSDGSRRRSTSDTAALILEPVQGLAGAYALGRDYLVAAREATEKAGALLIFDEVQCGLGRSGAPFVARLHGVTPDILTVGKGLAGGLAGGCASRPSRGACRRSPPATSARPSAAARSSARRS